MNRRRIAIGVFLMIISVGALIFWETKGRNEMLLDEVVVFTMNLTKDTKIEKNHLIKGKILKENKVAGFVDWKDHNNIIGKYLTTDVCKKSQASRELIKDEFHIAGKDKSIFVLPSSWIAMKSSALRRGDLVEIFDAEQFESLGIYKVAFVKDSSGGEITDELTGENKGALDRWKGSGVIDHVEIIADLKSYESLANRVIDGNTDLLLVQKEVF